MVFDLWSTGELPLDQDYKAEVRPTLYLNGDDMMCVPQYHQRLT